MKRIKFSTRFLLTTALTAVLAFTISSCKEEHEWENQEIRYSAENLEAALNTYLGKLSSDDEVYMCATTDSTAKVLFKLVTMEEKVPTHDGSRILTDLEGHYSWIIPAEDAEIQQPYYIINYSLESTKIKTIYIASKEWLDEQDKKPAVTR